MNNPPRKQKLYCFVDETGQDTKGQFYLVSVVITQDSFDHLEGVLEHIETVSQKMSEKWTRANAKRQTAYIEGVLNSQKFIDLIRFSVFEHHSTAEFEQLTVKATAQAIFEKAEEVYEANVFIDGIGKAEIRRIAAQLRRRQVRVKKVRGLTDEQSPMIRLADAMAGFIRAALQGDSRFVSLFEKAKDTGVIKQTTAKS